MIYSKSLKDWRNSIPRFTRRVGHRLATVRFGWNHPRQVCFVFGCQRSGTTILMDTAQKAENSHIYHEYTSLAFWQWRLRGKGALDVIKTVDPAYSLVFKPINDTQIADRIMAEWPDATAVWPYRHYVDVANSAVVKWGDHQRMVAQAIIEGRTDLGWRTERPPADMVEQLRAVWSDDFSAHEGAVAFWMLRNAYFFELDLVRDPRFMMVRYEHMVSRPLEVFVPLFEHMGASFDSSFVANITPRSIGRGGVPELRPELVELADALLARLDAEYERRTGIETSELPSPLDTAD